MEGSAALLWYAAHEGLSEPTCRSLTGRQQNEYRGDPSYPGAAAQDTPKKRVTIAGGERLRIGSTWWPKLN